MEWTGQGLIIGVRRHGESSVIAEAMVQGRGRHLGLVRSGRSRRQASTLQLGNSVQLVWRARLEDHLGAFTVELLQARAAELITDRTSLYVAQLLCGHLHLLPERDPHDRLLAKTLEILDGEWDNASLAVELARFEFMLLDEMGFGLDIYSCAVTGALDGLTHVSPKTGRAVTAQAAKPYIDRLLPLPAFLAREAEVTATDIADAFRVTGHFLSMHVWTARQIDPPATRDQLIEVLLEKL